MHLAYTGSGGVVLVIFTALMTVASNNVKELLQYMTKTKMHTFVNNLFHLNYPDTFRTSNCSSSGGILYKQLIVFHHAS
jgi:hypothetical protein